MLHAALAGLVLLAACTKPAPAPAGDAASPAAPAELPDAARITVTAARTDLVFTYVDAAGKFHDVTVPAEVPQASRAQVLVRDLSKSPDELRTADYLYVADLRVADEKGRFPCGAVSRRQFDRGGAGEAAAQVADQVAADGGAAVTVYSTAWCGVCKQAKAFLKQRGVAYLERDIEKDPGAEQELQRKAQAQGFRPSGVPVIDVGGDLMTGFDPEALAALLQRKGLAPGQ